MNIALFSDVHANLPALQAVFDHLDARTALTGVYHLGDLVGYAPWPNEVVDAIRARAIAGVGGNYDTTVGLGHDHCGCVYEDPVQADLSHESFAWTLDSTTDASKQWLASLPFRLDLRPLGGHRGGPRVMLVHGNPILNTVYWKADRSDGFCRKMASHLGARAGDVVAFGHTHIPWHRSVDEVLFVNTGSVGRPKDGDPRAGYADLSLGEEGWTVEHVRVPYDVGEAAAAIRASQLPDEFAVFLESGGRFTHHPPAGHD